MFNFQIESPATTANIGPGFDCLSAAYDMFNHVSVEVAETGDELNFSHVINNEDGGIETIAREHDLTVIGIMETFGILGHNSFGVNPLFNNDLVARLKEEIHSIIDYSHVNEVKYQVAIKTVTQIPISRGCGSSTAAYQAGILSAFALLTKSVDALIDPETGSLYFELQNFIAHQCIVKEGHPDNAVACAYGGCQAMLLDSAVSQEKGLTRPCYDINISNNLFASVIIPNRKTSTAEARAIMPSKYDADKSHGQLRSLLTCLHGLSIGSIGFLKEAFNEEQFHVPFRGDLNPHLAKIEAFIASRDKAMSDTLTVTLSGSGSTNIVLSSDAKTLECLDEFVASCGEDMVCKRRNVTIGGPGIRFRL